MPLYSPGGVSSVTGTANQITVTGTSAPVLSLPSGGTLPGAWSGAGAISAPGLAANLTGTSGRYIGATNGSPAGGPYLVGDWATDPTTKAIWFCTVAGSPGTWVELVGGSSALTAPVTITGTNANALAVGQNGATNPALQVDTTNGVNVTGLQIRSSPTTGAINLNAISSDVNTALNISTKGTGNMLLHAGEVLIQGASGTYGLAVQNGFAYLLEILTRSDKTSGALTTFTFVSGTGHKVDFWVDRLVWVAFTLNSSATLTATVLFELSPDNVTYSTVATVTDPASTSFVAGRVGSQSIYVPGGWYLRVTATNATINANSAYY